jgi:hypothetical protein
VARLACIRIASLFILSALCGVPLWAQTFRGAISGTLTDPSGAAIPDASIRLNSQATGLSRTTLTGGAGDFSFPDLPLGQYSLTVQKEGFQTLKMDALEAVVSKVTNVNLTLSVASQNAIVEVTAQAATLETTSTALVGVVGPRMVSDLPMNGRDFRQMLKLAPGVSPQSSSVNGNRTSGNNYQIDGADNNDAFHNSTAVNQGGVSGIAGTLLPIEAIDQFAVQTNAGAEVGRNSGSSVNLVIKSGTNQFHGSAYYFNRNEFFASASPFQTPGAKARKIRNDQYGFSLGGPVIKNKTFFFLTGEAQKAIAGLSLLNTHPSTAWVDNAKSVLARYNVPVNQVSTNLLSIWPTRGNALPATANNFLATDQNDYDSYNGIVKVDHNFNEANSLSVRYFGGTGKQAADIGIPYREFFQVAPSRMHNSSVVWNRILSPRAVLQTTLGVNYFKQTFNDEDTGYDPIALGLNTGVTEPNLKGSPLLRISGFAGVGGTQPLGRIDTTGHAVSNLSLNLGRHQWKIGGEYRRAVLDVFYDTDKRGRFTFDGSRGPWASDATLSAAQRSMADYMAGLVSGNSGSVIVRGQLQRDYLQNSFDWWAHDNWQVTPRFNLNYGVRYTYHGPLYDDENSITTFRPGQGFLTPGRDIGQLYPRDLNNFAPRMGFALTPKQGGSTVLRGSWGIFYDVPPLNFIVANTGMPNGGSAGVHANPGGPNPVFSIVRNSYTLVMNEPIFGTLAPRPPFGAFSVSENFRTPYVQNFNLNVQQQVGGAGLLQVGYVGSLGTKLSLLRNINAPVPGTTGSTQERRPFFRQYPELAAINELNTIANSNFHSMQMQFRMTRWKNFSGVANYTYGKSLDNGTNVRNALPANSYDLRREYGPTNLDIRQIFTGYVAYDVPQWSTRFRRLSEGWQLNSLFTFNTGEPMDLLAGTNVSGSADARDRVDVIGDAFSGVVQPTSGTARRWFNPAAFQRPATGTFGNIGRNALRGPGYAAVDFSVFKTTTITERVKLQFRAEIFNLFNRANLAAPGTNLAASTSFGLITNTRNGGSAPGLGQGEPRNTQLALKLIF